MKKFMKTVTIAALLTGSAYSTIPAESANAAAPAKPVVHEGEQQSNVWDLQHRLIQLGLYKGKLDGIFGPLTKEAVMKFQKNNKLPADGVVGQKTWDALYKTTLQANEIEMLAKVVHGEARGEMFEGKVAVAAVVLNRAQSDKFPDTVKGVIFEPYAFTAVDDGQYYTTPSEDAYRAVYKAIQGWDPSNGAIFYFNPDTAESDWMYTREVIKRIGKHVFMK